MAGPDVATRKWLKDPATWEAVSAAVATVTTHEYDLEDSSHRLDVVQIVCEAVARLAEGPNDTAAAYAHELGVGLLTSDEIEELRAWRRGLLVGKGEAWAPTLVCWSVSRLFDAAGL